MCKQRKLREYLKIVFYYEFETGYYGLETSEFTDEIIKCEVNRLARHRNDIEDGKYYLFKRCKSNYRLRAYENIEDILNDIQDAWDNVYVFTENTIELLTAFSGIHELLTIHTF